MVNFMFRIITKTVLRLIFELECYVARKWVSSAHKRLMFSQWGFRPTPEHFDHHIDLYYQWLNTSNPLWLERGVFGSLSLKGGNVLELACGDGFNAKNFYSIKSKKIVACDFDQNAIKVAKKKNQTNNIDFILADIRSEMPGKLNEFENIIWDAAIEHFTEEEIFKIMVDIKKRLKRNGVLSGYTIVENKDGKKMLEQHEYEFKSMEDLYRFFEPYFRNIKVFETVYKSRHNLYFWASDGDIPFDKDWVSMISKL